MVKNQFKTRNENPGTFGQELKILLRKVSEDLSTIFNSNYTWIGLIDEPEGKMKEAGSFGTLPQKETRLAQLQDDICKEVFEKGKSIRKQMDVTQEIPVPGENRTRSILCVPIKIDKIEKNRQVTFLTLGTLYLSRIESNNFSREDEIKIQTIAKMLAFTTWNYKYEFSEKFSKHFGYRILSVNLNESISDGLGKIIEIFGADHGTIYRYDKETQNFFNVIAKGVSEKFWEHAVPRKDGVAAHVIKYTEPCFLDDVSKDSLFSDSPFTRGEDVKSTAAASLDGEGVLFLSYSKKHKFSDIEKQQFNLLSKVIAAVFRSLRLTEELKWGKKYEVSRAPHWTETIKLFFEKKLLKKTDIDAIRLYAFDSNSKRYSLAVESGAISPFVSSRAKKGGIVDKLAKSKKSLFYEKIEGSPLENSPITIREGIKSVAVLPLNYGSSEVLGVLFVNYRSFQKFTPEKKEILIGLAEFLALILNSVSKETELTRTANVLQNLHRYKPDEKVEDIHLVLQTVTDGIAYLTKADSVIILMHRKKKREFLPEGVHGIEKEDISDKFPLSKGIGRKVLDTGKEKTISDLDNYDPQHILFRRAGIRSLTCVPLIYSKEIIGLLYLGYRSKKFPIPDYSRELLQIFYGEASQRIGNYISEQKFNQKQKQLESLLDITKIIHASKLKLNKTLNDMTKIITDKLGYGRGIVSLKEKIGEKIYFKRVAFIGLELAEIKRLSKKSSWNTEEQINKILIKEFQISNSYYIPSKHKNKVKETLTSVSEVEPDEYDERKSFEWQPGDYLLIPLRKGGKIIGLLSVDEPVDKATPTIESVKTLEIFAEHLVLAIENARRYKRRTEELKILKKIDKEIINKIGKGDEEAFGLSYVLASIIEKSWIIGDVDYADIFLKYGEKLVRKAAFTSSKSKYKGEVEFAITEEKSIVAYVTRQKKPQLIRNIEEPKWKDKYSPTHDDIRSELAVPMMQGDKVIGVINVESSNLGAFDKEDQNYLEALAAQSVIAIQNANAYEQKVRRLKEYDILNSIEQKKIGSSLDLGEIVKHVLDVVIKNTNSEIGSISLWHKDTNELEILAIHGIYKVEMNHRYKKGITIMAAQQEKPIYVPDLDEQCPCCIKGSWAENHFYPIKGESVKSELAIPIMFDETVLGVINLESNETDAFKDHIPLVTFISSQIGRAIEQAKRHEKKLKEEEGRVTRDLWGFLGQTMMHELHSNLAAIGGNLETLSLFTKDEDEERKEVIRETAITINNILYEIKRLPEETSLEKFEIQDLLVDIIDECSDYREYHKGIEVSQNVLDEKIIVEANRKCISAIIRNLLQNAFAAVPGDGELRIEVKKFQHRAEIFFKDTGIGISDEIREKLFHSIVKSEKGGMGIYLWISKSLMVSFNGDIELVKSEKDKGTTFKLWLPIVPEVEGDIP
jgi:GAF domain-containing protein/anti-sigma regulatory factor (Ser/Thr protein kinase)